MLPGESGAGFSAPLRSPSQAAKSGHQEPFSAVASASQASGSGGVSGAVRYTALALPTGLTMEAICPLRASTKRLSPPSSWVLR